MSEDTERPKTGKGSGKGAHFRGNKPPGSGRPKGSPNKITREFRDIVQSIINKNADKVDEWLDATARKNPAKALELLNKLAEYAAPKLSRSEITGPGGVPLAPPSVLVTIDTKLEES